MVFAHLHVRSGHSPGFGTATPRELAEAAADTGHAALALTDRDGLHGVPRFLSACGEAGISPVVGVEVSIEGGGHVVLLAEGMEGYRSLCRLTSEYRLASGPSAKERRNPRCPLPLLAEHAEGLVCLTGAVPFGLLPGLLLSGRSTEARTALSALREAFGEGNLFVELTDDRTARSRRRISRVEAFAKENGLPTLATNEIAYLRPEDHRLHEVLVAAHNLCRLPGPGYRPTDGLYLKSPQEMGRLFADRPEALRNAALVAERCAGAVVLSGGVHVPAANLREGETAGRKLLLLALAGARERYRGAQEVLLHEVKKRLRREFSCISELGFAPYFLLAHEAKEIAREKGIPVTGRGSAANSLVSYCLGLTQPEPLSNRLLFERFMHEGRRDAPDIDLDLCSRRRDEVRDELTLRHARRGVAVAATVQTMSLRGAVRVAALALGHPPREIDQLSRHVPTRFTDRGGAYDPLSGWGQALAEPQMRGHPLRDAERHRLLLDLTWRLSGRVREAGTHNGGMIFGSAERRLPELVPLEPSGSPGLVRCQYDKDDLEYVGLPKLDLLGLRMHTALHRAGELASERLGEKVDPYDPPPDDKAAYALIRTGRNTGMFQLESPGQMHLSRRLKPRRFSDLVAQISLFRPGPVRGDLVTPYVLRRNGKEPYSVPLPDLDEVLRPTYGVLVFQEQVLEVAHRVAGFSLAEGDRIRRAMKGDRGPGAMRRLREGFVRRAVGRGVPEGTARKVFAWTEGFAAYGFSAAHAASFAEMAYASAYMRVHHPAEFFCGLLDAQPMGFYSPRALLNEARRIGLSVLPPDVHLSGEGFSVEEGGAALRVGLDYTKGISRAAVSSILREREKGPFASPADLYRRTAVGRDALENMTKGGFLDALSPTGDATGRAALLAQARALPPKPAPSRRGQEALPLPHPARRTGREGTIELRGPGFLPLPSAARERMEWEALSLNVSRHPLSPYREALSELGVTASSDLPELPHGARTRAAGLLESLQRPPTKSGHPVYFLLVEDERGLLQATLFRSVYERCGHLLHTRGVFLLDVRVEQDERRGFSFLVERISDLSDAFAGTDRLPEPRVVPGGSGAFLRAGRRGRRAG